MKNQFFYKRKQPIQPVEGQTEVKMREFIDSFNIELVVRTAELEDGRRYVVLNDMHERIYQEPQENRKGEVVSYINKKMTAQSEIYLEKADSDKFVELMIDIYSASQLNI